MYMHQTKWNIVINANILFNWVQRYLSLWRQENVTIGHIDYMVVLHLW